MTRRRPFPGIVAAVLGLIVVSLIWSAPTTATLSHIPTPSPMNAGSVSATPTGSTPTSVPSSGRGPQSPAPVKTPPVGVALTQEVP